MEKIYCSLCRYCDTDHCSESYYRCRHPKHMGDTFYERSWNSPYCSDKNYHNNCEDFRATPQIERKIKRKIWFNNLKNTLYNKAKIGALQCCAFLSKRFKLGSILNNKNNVL